MPPPASAFLRWTEAVMGKMWGAGMVLLLTAASEAAKGATEQEIERGPVLHAANCAGCHGAGLQGQRDWKCRPATGRMPAPPHDVTGHTWHHSDSDLFKLTKRGVAAVAGADYESDMPGFGDRLSDPDIKAVLDYIMSTWPERARLSQKAVTADEEASQP